MVVIKSHATVGFVKKEEPDANVVALYRRDISLMDLIKAPDLLKVSSAFFSIE